MNHPQTQKLPCYFNHFSTAMPRQPSQILEPIHGINTAQILKESIRIVLLHLTYFHSISIFLFSPLSLSLFISHFLIHHFPQLPLPTIKIMDNLLMYPIPEKLSQTILHLVLCFPASISFSLLGRAATIQVVADTYKGIDLNRRRLLRKSGSPWIKLLHTILWEYIIILFLFTAFVSVLALVTKIQYASEILRLLGVIWFLGVPFCIAFAHLMVVGDLAKVLTVLENECCGIESFLKAKRLMKGSRQTGLVMALLSNMSLRLVECLFELRMCRNNISVWEGGLLISMYSMLLVFDTVMNVVFYYACKSINN